MYVVCVCMCMSVCIYIYNMSLYVCIHVPVYAPAAPALTVFIIKMSFEPARRDPQWCGSETSGYMRANNITTAPSLYFVISVKCQHVCIVL